MEAQTLELEPRTSRGKGAARQLRAHGKIPAVVYGPGAEPTAVSVSPKALTSALSTEYRRNVLIRATVEGKEELTMLKDLDVHPVTKSLIHADFYRVTKDTKVRVAVPFKTESRAIGVQRGGKLKLAFRDLPVEATPETIPASIVLDVANLDLHQAMTVSDLNLPEGVRVCLDGKAKVVMIGGEQKKRGAAEAQEGETAEAG